MGKHSGQTVSIHDPVSGKTLSYDPQYVPEPFDMVWLGVGGAFHPAIVVEFTQENGGNDGPQPTSGVNIRSFMDGELYVNCGYAPVTPYDGSGLGRSKVFCQSVEDVDLARNWPGYLNPNAPTDSVPQQ